MHDILTIRQLECGYDGETLIGPFDAAIPEGVFLLVEGPNGIGKSTLLETLVGLVEPIDGTYEWSIPDERISFVPQVRTLDPVLPATVGDVVATGSQQGSGWSGLRVSATDDELEDALEAVGMRDYRTHLFRELSEGQKQLVLLARALMGTLDVLVLDEPTASMDPERERRAVELLERQHHERDLSVFMIAHGSEATRRASNARLQIDRDRNLELDLD